MNKKFLTALLLGAFTIASTSTLVSCKDYDDDINNLQEQINNNGTSIQNVQNALNQAKTELQAKIAELQEQHDKDVKALEEADDKLKKQLEDATDDLTKQLQAEIARAKDAEDQLDTKLLNEVKRLQGLISANETRIKACEDAIDLINEALDTKVDKAVFNATVDEINAKISALGDDLKDAKEKLQAAIDAEKERALAAEAALDGKIDAEKVAREAAIKAEQDARKAAIEGLQTQVDALKAFDTAIDARVKKIEDDYLTSADKKELKDLIAAEKAALQNEIKNLETALTAKITALETELKGLIEAEKAAREQAVKDLDDKLTKAIQDEAAARQAADAAEADARAAADLKEKQERVAAIQEEKEAREAAIITLQNQINQLNKKLGEEVARLEVLIDEAKAAAKTAQETADQAIEDAAAAQAYAEKVEEALNAEIDRAKAAEKKVADDLAQEVEDRIAAVNKEAEERAKQDGILDAAIKAEEARAKGEEDALKDLIEAEEAARDAADKAIWKEINEDILPRLEAVEEAVVTLEHLIWDSLRALVLEPASYYHGIQAIDITTLNYGKIELKDVDADGDYAEQEVYVTEGYIDNTPVQLEQKSVVPEMKATYHMNPSTAVVSTDVSKYAFLPLDRKYTRVLASEDIVITKVEPNVNAAGDAQVGMLTVTAKLNNAEEIKNIARDEMVTVAALQYTDGEKDTTITSDYAAFLATFISNFRLNNVAAQGAHNHLPTIMYDAIEESAAFEIAWDTTGVDLDELVNTHVAKQGGSSDVALDAKAASGELKAMGLVYNYELVGYLAEEQTISESAWAAINDENILRPQLTADGKQQAYGAEQGKAEIGHQPIVRVSLVYEETGDVVAVGYIKFIITPKTPVVVIEHEITDEFTLDCGNSTVVLNDMSFLIDEAAQKVFEEVNIPVDDFFDYYALDTYTQQYMGIMGPDGVPVVEPSSEELAKQYKNFGYDAEAKDPKIGAIRQTTNDDEKDVLQWVINNNTAYQQFKTANSVDVYVRFAAIEDATINGAENTLKYVFVHFIWTPSAINVTPTASLANDKSVKIDQFWYAHNQILAGTGFDDIHGNVEVVGDNNNCDFVFDVKGTFVTNVPKLTLDPTYTAINAAAQQHFEFVTPTITTVKGESGKEYTLKVSEDGGALIASYNGEDSIIATIITTPVVDPYSESDESGVVTYQDNQFAYDVLNHAAHNKLGDGETLTGRIGIKVTTCDPTGNLVVENGEFDVKFLRPITITDGKANFIDAHTNGSRASVNLTFTDWRDHEFISFSNSEGVDYFDYYKVEKIDADTAMITTNLSGGTLGTTLLSSITKKLAFGYEAPTNFGPNGYIKAGEYGTMIYHNSGYTVGEFMIRVPIKVTYRWGVVSSYVDCTIGKTIGNVKKQ